MFHDVGKKLKICAYIFIVFYVFKSICFQFQFMWSLQSMMVLFIDFIFAVVIALVIYGSGLVIQLFENRKVL